MSNHHRLFVAALTLGVVSLVGCNPSQVTEPPTESTAAETPPASTNETTDPLEIMVSITPQKYFVERIGGDRVKVGVLLPSGANHDTYEPKPRQLQSLGNADAYVRIHVTFEDAWWNRISSANANMQVIDLTEGIEPIAMSTEHDHHGADTKEHTEKAQEVEVASNSDPHIWLSPPLVKQQAQTIYNALVELDPQNQQMYRDNLERFISKIDRLDKSIKANLSNLENRTFMVFHPSWGYFADAYDLQMISIEVGGNEPSAMEMSQLIDKAEAENIKVIFAQPQFSTKNAQTIANEIDGEVVLIDPLAEDWMSNMRKVANTFKRVLN